MSDECARCGSVGGFGCYECTSLAQERDMSDDSRKDLEAYAVHMLGRFRGERDEIGGALLTAIIANMPWGKEVDLGMGRKAKLVPMNNAPDLPRPKRQPIYADDASPVAGDNDLIGYGEWSFTFDWMLTHCDQDHVEVTVKITGGGGGA